MSDKKKEDKALDRIINLSKIGRMGKRPVTSIIPGRKICPTCESALKIEELEDSRREPRKVYRHYTCPNPDCYYEYALYLGDVACCSPFQLA